PPAHSPSQSSTPSGTLTVTQTPSASGTPTLSATATDSPTITSTPSATASYTPQPPYSVKVEVYNSAGELVGVIADSLAVYQEPRGLQAVQADFVPDAGGKGSFMILGTNGNGPDLVFEW